MKKQIYSKTCW